jgi:hypothetical protein
MGIRIVINTCVLCLAFNSNGRAQINFFTTVGLAERITPVYTGGIQFSTSSLAVRYNEHKQLTGNGIGISMGFNDHTTGIVLEYGQTYRYDHVYYQNEILMINLQMDNKSIDKFILDHHLFITKYFKKGSFYFGPTMGFSLMNNGASYSYLTSTIIQNDTAYWIRTDDFAYKALSLGFSCQAKNILFKMTGYFSGQTHFMEANEFILPEISVRYYLKLCRL